MIAEKNVFILLSFVIFFLTGSVFADDINQPSESSRKGFPVTSEEWNQLDEDFQEFHQVLDNFLELNRRADKERPGLIATEVAYFRLRHITRDREFPGSKKTEEFGQRIGGTSLGDKYERLLMDCKAPFAAKIAAKAVQDPEWSEELKPAYLLKYRHTYGKLEDGREDKLLRYEKREHFTAFDANEPNDDILWENIKKHIIEVSKSYEQERKNLLIKTSINTNAIGIPAVEEQIPVYVAEAAGYMEFAREMKIWTRAWIRIYAPGEISQSLREVSRNSGILAIYHKLKRYLDKQKNSKFEELMKNLSWYEYRLFLEGKRQRVSDDDYCQNKFLYELIHNEFYPEFFVTDSF